MKILHCPVNTGGHPVGLCRAERKLGLTSQVMVFNDSWLKYPVDVDLEMSGVGLVRGLMKKTSFLLKSAVKYDLFHFNFGCTFFRQMVDMPLLRSLGKTVWMTYQGCDARQTGYCTANMEVSACSQCDYTPCDERTDRRKRLKIRLVRMFADRIFCLNPDLMRVIPGAEFLPYASVNPREWTPVRKSNSPKIRIIHAPTNRAIKGTDYVVKAVDMLRRRFENVELTLCEGIPHGEIRPYYEQADIVVDQLLCGWYGSFAVEMMALGKPVVCYIRDEDLQFIPEQMAGELPVVRATTDSLYRVLEELVQNPQLCEEQGAKSRAYVERWHDPLKIARKIHRI